MSEREMEKIIGAFLFPEIWQPWTLAEGERFLETLARFGVNAIFTEAETYRADLLALAHRLRMRWFGSISCFSDHAHNHKLLQERPELWPIEEDGRRRKQQEWYIGLPPTFEDYNLSRLELIRNLINSFELDGFFLDFIRWPLHWELECRPNAPRPRQSSFDAHTLARFQEEMGLQVPPHLEDTASQAAWILSHHREEWVDFKCRIITDFVARASQIVRAERGPGYPLGLYLLPLKEEERASLAGQSLPALAPLVHLIAPMAYHAILHCPPSWVREVIEETSRIASGKVLPVLQVDSAEGQETGADWGPPLPAPEWEEVVRIALHAPNGRGLIAFTGTALRREDRGERLHRQISSLQEKT